MSGRAESSVAHVFATITFDIQVTRYTLVAGGAVWAYDILLTFNDEVSLLWSRGGILVKLLYLINRYLPLALLSTTLIQVDVPGRGAIPVNVCRVHFVIITICQIVGIIVATTIFTVRLYTIYHGNRIVQRALVLLAGCSYLALLVCGILLIKDATDSMTYSEPLATCIGSPSPSLSGIYVAPILLESVIAIATLFHAIRFRRQQRALEQTSTTMNIMNALYIDGVMYYMIVLSLRIGVCLVFWIARPSLILLLCYLEYFLTSVITARWFLSFRRVLVDALTPKASTFGDMTRMTGAVIDFAPPGSGATDDLESRRQCVHEESEDNYFADSHELAERKKSPV